MVEGLFTGPEAGFLRKLAARLCLWIILAVRQFFIASIPCHINSRNGGDAILFSSGIMIVLQFWQRNIQVENINRGKKTQSSEFSPSK